MREPARHTIAVLLRAAVAAFTLLLAWSCSTYDATKDMESRVARHMAIADSLERAGDLANAALEYSLVAQHYPASLAHPAAVRKTALLLLDPRNPASSDSVALRWLNVYLHVPAGHGMNDDARIEITLLQRIASVELNLARAVATADSFLQVIRRQDGLLNTQTQRLQEAELQLKQARQELSRLKEVDVQLSRSRRRP